MRNSIATIFLVLAALCASPVAVSQESTPAETTIQPSLEQQLTQLLESAERKQRALDALGKRRAELPAGMASVQVDNEIEATQKQLNDLREQFQQLATNNFNFSLSPINPAPQVDINWQKDIIQIIHPLLREMKDLTERPRMIEKLNGEINLYREQAADLESSLANLQKLQTGVTNPQVLRSLKSLAANINERHADIDQKLNVLDRQLQELRERPSEFSAAFAAGVRSFAINVGLYLLLAAAVSLAIFLIVRLIGKLIGKAILDRYDERLIFVERGVHLLTQVLSAIFAVLSFLAVLYAVDAWVLFALFLIITLGLVLSLRSMVPTYVMEMRTLLNLGSLRQNERLILNGLPWRIVALDVYTLLHNPSLNAFMRMPLMQISKMSSRPSQPNEPWFPTEVGDYVLLLDGMFGRVEFQTPETVQVNFGEAMVHYRTEQFLNQRPQNLTKRGFTVGTDFGIDYQHRHEATSTIVDTLRYELEGAIRDTEFGEHNLATNVETKIAGASSLDFRISATFNGNAAEMYFRIQRWLQKFAIDCANKHGWEIPFPQMTVHYSKEKPKLQMIDPSRDDDVPPEMVHM
ncbi:MAG: hypothetical protein QM709_01305 [Spongiibacteraceae bacterium]